MQSYNYYRMRLLFGSQIMAEMVLLGFIIVVVLGENNAKADFTFGTPMNLGPMVNTSHGDADTCLSMDMLELYFDSDRPGGSGNWDLWVSKRTSKNDDWTQPMNLGPTVNSSAWYHDASISADKLLLLFGSNRSGGHGGDDIWATKRATINDAWSTPVNLGANINSSNNEMDPALSADGLQLYFCSQNRPGGYGSFDIFVSTRASLNDDWGPPVNLGPPINTSYADYSPSMSADGLTLFFCSERTGGYGDADLWATRRPTTNDDWGEPINLGPTVNSLDWEGDPDLSSDGTVLLFTSDRPGGYGSWDAWQTQIEPICDLDNDLKVNLTDMRIMVDHWGENYPSCDIGPTPFGDGIVDVQDLIVLAEHLFEEPELLAYWKLDETEGNIAYDSAGTTDATLSGEPVWQPGGDMVSGTLQFDGIEDYANAGFILNPSDGPFSVFAWIKGGAPGQVVLSQLNGANWLATDPDLG
jgi:Tol biopolymer transport system component